MNKSALIFFLFAICVANPVMSQETDPVSTPSTDSSKASEDNSTTKSPHAFSGYLTMISDYRFRGISQTFKKPAIQGNMEYSHHSGFYAGSWASNTDGTCNLYNNTSLEWDLYAGIKNPLLPCKYPDLIYNLGIIFYYFPGGQVLNSRHTRYNSAEVYLELVYKWMSVKAYHMVTDFVGINSNNPPFNWKTLSFVAPNGSSKGSTYIEGNVTVDLLDKICYGLIEGGKLNVVIHAGYQYIRHYEMLSYTDWRITVTQTFDWFNLFASYVGTDAKHDFYTVPDKSYHAKKYYLGAQGIVYGITKTF